MLLDFRTGGGGASEESGFTGKAWLGVDEENPESLKPLIDGGTEGKIQVPYRSYTSTNPST